MGRLKYLRTYIQPGQVLGCAAYVLLENGMNRISISELLRVCREIDDIIDGPKYNSILEVNYNRMMGVVDVWKEFFTYEHDGIVLIKNIQKEKIDDVFICTIPLHIKDVMYNYFKNNVDRIGIVNEE